jgi:hypothetical protein
MDLAWGEGLGEESKGLDIVGVRGLDQSFEAALVNGITTISLRGRYLTLLPWAIGEFFAAEAVAEATEFAPARLRAFLARVEFLTLACTTLDPGSGDPGGALGRLIYQRDMADLTAGEPAAFPTGSGVGMLGTYFGPCRALGLVRSESGLAAPFVLTPRGQAVWDARKAALGDGYWRTLLWDAERLGVVEARALVPHFSLKRLGEADGEAAALREALLTPWSPAGPAAASVTRSYGRFAQTIAWLQAQATSAPLRADALLAEVWRTLALGEGGDADVEECWAEYEWRRRLHFALELILSAVADTVRAGGAATLPEVVAEWLSEPDLPPHLTDAWPQAALASARSGQGAFASVPTDLFLAEAPPNGLARLRPHARALSAFALVSGLAVQSRDLRAAGRFQDRAAPGERALACVEGAGEESFAETLHQLADTAVQAHLATTFRKMGGGQKCSLRLFPEGSRFLTTDLDTGAGRSGSRLSNVIKVLEDAAVPHIGASA